MMRRERWKFDRAGSSASPAPTNAESRFQRLPLASIGSRRHPQLGENRVPSRFRPSVIMKPCRRSAIILSLFCLSLGWSGASPAQLDAPPVDMSERVAACSACHGEQGRATADGFYPRIAGKPAGYLYNQLLNFKQGRRYNRVMIHLVEYLPDDYLREIAVYFSQQHPPYPEPAPVDGAADFVAHGRDLVERGDPARDVPACTACHGETLTGVAPNVPGLLGLPRDYLAAQLGAWHSGARHAMAPDCMGSIARRLDAQDIGAVSAWLASQPVRNQGVPAAAPPGAWPIDCGGVQ